MRVLLLLRRELRLLQHDNFANVQQRDEAYPGTDQAVRCPQAGAYRGTSIIRKRPPPWDRGQEGP